MPFEHVFVPFRGYWSSPFCRWQGSLAQAHSLELAADAARRLLAARGIDAAGFDTVLLGMTVPQKASFYGAPWLAGLLGAPGVTGPTVSQACATSASLITRAALEIEAGLTEQALAVACDRTSNGPLVYYPNPQGPGGMGEPEHPVWDNFGRDPFAGNAMIDTAEQAARRAGISRAAQDEMALLRAQQYQDALADDRAFQRPYLLPLEVPAGRKKTLTVAADEGVFPTTAEGLAALKPVQPGGTVTFGTQTHPADGNAGMILTTRARARALSAAPNVEVRLRGVGRARVEQGFMPLAPVPAARAALAHAGLGVEALTAIKTHNPFAVNDVYFCRQFDLPPERVNRFGSPLVYGHPQGPTGLRAMIELIEELAAAGGGCGLFTGCAAGDTAMAAVFEVRA